MWSSRGLENLDAMSSDRSLMNKNNTIGIQTLASDSSTGHDPQTGPFSKEDDNTEYSSDEQGRHARAKAQKEEIQFLREKIVFASVKERQLLNEKYTLEKKFAELRLALDEKQNEAIESAANELARRKGVLDENLKLAHELKVTEDERYIFMSSLVGLLVEYGILPQFTNAAALSDSVKHLHDQMQQKIRESQGQQRYSPSPYDNSIGGRHLEPIYDVSRYTPESDPRGRNSLMLNGQMNTSLDNDIRPVSRLHSQNAPVYASNRVDNRFEETPDNNYFQPPPMHDGGDSYALEEDGPGIESFQIIGDAKPGGKLLGCGFPVRGTSLCMFQWVRHLQDGTREYIEGATNPEYVVTADDVDKLIAVECIPMDDQGRQGEIVRLFANEQNKITCDPEMQQEIDKYMAAGQASFGVLLLMDSSENWEQTTLSLGRLSYQIKVNRTQDVFIHEKYSNDVSIKIPAGLTTQFVLTCADGSSHPFNTFHDVRMRDTLVLTMRMFQSKALDDRRKSKA
ncbi:uncharacterized protein LOC112520533 isoform X1 [Cynara cardunculus var. scolymus]|uniref:uncharacterized protein LOC112520533 isoform X1 n=2 Tax=Cynara cardunculus var. scolymus TaxID=59895 RepID=UPI000D62CF81|nr:uncharacterized protein LOC112520533 isoform X1 [Cynara cardunculus var. scolymus]XP_024984757.1 uncharacterized protein LOC112520533 isoform X1 [Cynara cardunculus var. scolymus]XP_024984759.1 uncharacterized protein LOC112520533 isoform X1 [Cynara cardunculus var. scolymus]XP_024984760.1 uncharacterized protein LOC112520533 isoform X1 [Cynara cardunculus var. scolymus]